MKKARLITFEGRYLATVDLQPDAPLPAFLGWQGRSFTFDTGLIVGECEFQYREYTRKSMALQEQKIASDEQAERALLASHGLPPRKKNQ